MIYFEALCLYFGFITLVNSNRYPLERCEKDDCSSQLQPFQKESCLMHQKTEVCLQYMSNFTQGPDIKLESEEDAKFSGFISPYRAERVTEFYNFSAINISFVIHKKGVDALVIKINKLCRMFDFRSSKRLLSTPVTFFYDCLYFPLRSGFQHVQVDMISLPSNEHLTYYVYIPDSNSISNPCYWLPVIMVFCGRLIDGVVQIKFSHAPQQLNITFYTVELNETSSKKIIYRTIPSDKKTDMLTAEFLAVPYGYYSARVKPANMNCPGAKTVAFQVGKSMHDIIIMISICIIILFIICSFAVYKFCILPYKLKKAQRNSNKSFEVNPEDSSTRSSDEDNEDNRNIPFLSSSISDFDEEVEDLQEKYLSKFS